MQKLPRLEKVKNNTIDLASSPDGCGYFKDCLVAFWTFPKFDEQIAKCFVTTQWYNEQETSADNPTFVMAIS